MRFITAAAVSIFVSSFVWAQDAHKVPNSALEKGMSRNAVLKMWGAPGDKLEMEAKREEKWIYDNANVIFSQGRVIAWFSDHQDELDKVEMMKESKEMKADKEQDATVEDILKGIMDEGEGSSKGKSDLKNIGKNKNRRSAPPIGKKKSGNDGQVF